MREDEPSDPSLALCQICANATSTPHAYAMWM